MVIFSQCLFISKHQIAHLKYVQFLCINYISIKPEKKPVGKIERGIEVFLFVCLIIKPSVI